MAKRSLALRFERTTAIILSGGLVLVAVLYFFVMSPVTSRHASTETQLAQLDQQITSLEQRTSQIAAGSSTLKNMYQHDLVLDGLLPNTLNQAQEFIALSQGMTASGLVIDSFASVPAGTSSLSVAGATSLSFDFTVQGTVAQIVTWLHSLSSSQGFVTVTGTHLTAGSPSASGTANAAAQAVLTGTLVVWQATTPGLLSSPTTTVPAGGSTTPGSAGSGTTSGATSTTTPGSSGAGTTTGATSTTVAGAPNSGATPGATSTTTPGAIKKHG